MSQNKQSEQNQTAVQARKPKPAPTADMESMALESFGQLTPALSTSFLDMPESNALSLQQKQVMRMQKQQGNAYVQRHLNPTSQPHSIPTVPKLNYPIQTKLSVNEPDDQYEKEADQVAEQVMRLPASAPPPVDEETTPPQISRVQRKADGVSGQAVSNELESSINSMNGGGSPLPDTERTFFEERMGADFSDVRIHTDNKAVETSTQLQAKAYTTGSNIAFNAGEYQPASDSGRKLIAHELTHVIQQGGASVKAKLQRTESDENASNPPTPQEQQSAEASAVEAEALATEARSDAQTNVADSQSKAEEEQANKEDVPPATGLVVADEPSRRDALPHDLPELATAEGVQAEQDETADTVEVKPEEATNIEGGADVESATSTAKMAVETGFSMAEDAPDKAPETPHLDPAYTSVTDGVTAVGTQEKTHQPAQNKAQQAQSAAVSPSAELDSQAQTHQVDNMQKADTPTVDASAFKQALLARIEEIAPKTAGEADTFKEDHKAEAIKEEMVGQVEAQKGKATTPLQAETASAPDSSAVSAKPVTPLKPEQAGIEPALPQASKATPKPKGQGEIETPLQASDQALDKQLADAQLTPAQLANSNEPEFINALAVKGEAQTAVKQAPTQYRQFEQTQLTQAKAESTTIAKEGLAGMHSQRIAGLAQVGEQQASTKSEDEAKRAEIGNHITAIYQRTKTEVDTILNSLDDKVNKAFDAGASKATKTFEDFIGAKMEAYKQRRYGGRLGWAKWLKDKLLGLPEEVNSFYKEGRQLYLTQMTAVIDEVTILVSTTLTQAKTKIAQGKQEIQTYVSQLPTDLQSIGQEASQTVQGQFDQLEQGIQDKQTQLVNTLAQKYQENLQKVDTRIKEMKDTNRGLVDKAIDAVGGVIETVLKLKQMLLEVLQSASDVVMQILKDPIGFVGNFIEAVGQGLSNFASNFLTHLSKGFVGWLTGAMGGAGLQMPKDIFSFEGVFDLVSQVLGLTWENVRARAVGVFGERAVGRLEQGFEFFVIIKEKGLAGLWEWVQGQLGNLKEQVIDGIQDMLMTEVVQAGIKWLAGILGGPAGAFIKAATTLYNIVSWFINNGSQALELVQSIIKSVSAIASGQLGAAAKLVEESLAKFIPVAIGFLASLLGIGDLSQRVRKIIETVRQPVNNVIDWVLKKAKTALSSFGLGKKGNKNVPKDKKKALQAGVATLREQEKAKAKKDGGVSADEAQEIATSVKGKHAIFKTLTPVEGKDSWNYDYVMRSKDDTIKGQENKQSGGFLQFFDKAFKAIQTTLGIKDFNASQAKASDSSLDEWTEKVYTLLTTKYKDNPEKAELASRKSYSGDTKKADMSNEAINASKSMKQMLYDGQPKNPSPLIGASYQNQPQKVQDKGYLTYPAGRGHIAEGITEDQKGVTKREHFNNKKKGHESARITINLNVQFAQKFVSQIMSEVVGSQQFDYIPNAKVEIRDIEGTRENVILYLTTRDSKKVNQVISVINKIASEIGGNPDNVLAKEIPYSSKSLGQGISYVEAKVTKEGNHSGLNSHASHGIKAHGKAWDKLHAQNPTLEQFKKEVAKALEESGIDSKNPWRYIKPSKNKK